MSKNENPSKGHHVRFLFDPACPWAWRASLWIRAVAGVRPLTIQWDLLSLEYLNRENRDDPHRELHRKTRHAVRLLAKAEEVEGNEGMGRLYMAISVARYEKDLELDDPQVLLGALKEAGLPYSLLEEARVDPTLDTRLQKVYQEACAVGAFGVPTLFFDHRDSPYFGPVIDTVPDDSKAGQLWDLILELSHHEYFYELKRKRQ